MTMTTYERRGAIAVLTLDNPDKYNALSGSMLADLDRRLRGGRGGPRGARGSAHRRRQGFLRRGATRNGDLRGGRGSRRLDARLDQSADRERARVAPAGGGRGQRPRGRRGRRPCADGRRRVGGPLGEVRAELRQARRRARRRDDRLPSAGDRRAAHACAGLLGRAAGRREPRPNGASSGRSSTTTR